MKKEDNTNKTLKETTKILEKGSKEEVKEDKHKDIIVSNKKPESLTEKIDYVMDNIDIITQKKKEKKNKYFKLPYNVRSKLKTLSEKNKVMVFYLTNVGNMNTVVADITKNGFIFIDGNPHDMSILYRFLYQGKYPAVIIMEWSIEPVGTKEYYDAHDNGKSSAAYAKIIQLVESGELKQGVKMSGKNMFLVFIGAIIIGYILFNKQ